MILLRLTLIAGLVFTLCVSAAITIGRTITDANLLAFISEYDINTRIYVAHVDRSIVRLLPQNTRGISEVSWRPGTMHLTYTRQQSNTTELWALPINERKSTHVASFEANTEQYSWSPDGSRIAYINPQYGLSLLYVADGEKIDLIEGERSDFGAAPVWSQDGTMIAFTYQETLSTIRLNEDQSPETTHIIRTGVRNASPLFSSDGSSIAFLGEVNGDIDIFQFNLADESVQPLIREPGKDFNPSLSSPQNILAFETQRDGNNEIYLYDIAQAKAHNISHHPEKDFSPHWSHNGQYLAFLSVRAGNIDVFVTDDKGTYSLRLSPLETAEYAPAWRSLTP